MLVQPECHCHQKSRTMPAKDHAYTKLKSDYDNLEESALIYHILVLFQCTELKIKGRQRQHPLYTTTSSAYG